MSQSAEDFDAFRTDLISHLSQKLDLPADLVVSKLGEWLLDREQHAGPHRVPALESQQSTR